MNNNKLELFIEKANIIHNNYYDYSKVVYNGSKSKVEIICPVHGSFWQKPNNHLQEQNCPNCAKQKLIINRTNTTENFIKQASVLHNNKYDYSKVEYNNHKIDVIIICSIHGEFKQTPSIHLRKSSGCPICKKEELLIRNKLNFINRSNIIHNYKYNYELSNYINTYTKINILCPIHGEFWQLPPEHTTRKSGCPKCAHNFKSTTENFIISAKKIHAEKYDYSTCSYENALTKVSIICRIHGEFKQRPNDHLNGAGCPKCVFQISKGQKDLYDFVKSLDDSAILEDRTNYPGLQLDITIPSKNLAIEYNGIYWHAINYKENYRYLQRDHLKDKLIKAQEYGLRILNIYEDEWENNRDQIKQIISNALNIENKINLEECTLWKVFSDSSHWKSHIEEFIYKYQYPRFELEKEAVAYCLIHNKQIVACAYFDEDQFKFIKQYNIDGALNKLIAEFLKDNPQINSLRTYLDARFFTSKEYINLGFKQIDWIDPSISVIHQNVRKHKSCLLFSAEELKNHTHFELATKLNWYVVPDCGQLVFEYTI